MLLQGGTPPAPPAPPGGAGLSARRLSKSVGAKNLKKKFKKNQNLIFFAAAAKTPRHRRQIAMPERNLLNLKKKI